MALHAFGCSRNGAGRHRRTDEGQVPKRLEDLVPRHVKELPKDPFATKITAAEKELGNYTPSLEGWGYRYRPGIGDAFILASVGLPDFPYRPYAAGACTTPRAPGFQANSLCP